jgi:hypothetical protein
LAPRFAREAAVAANSRRCFTWPIATVSQISAASASCAHGIGSPASIASAHPLCARPPRADTARRGSSGLPVHASPGLGSGRTAAPQWTQGRLRYLGTSSSGILVPRRQAGIARQRETKRPCPAPPGAVTASVSIWPASRRVHRLFSQFQPSSSSLAVSAARRKASRSSADGPNSTAARSHDRRRAGSRPVSAVGGCGPAATGRPSSARYTRTRTSGAGGPPIVWDQHHPRSDLEAPGTGCPNRTVHRSPGPLAPRKPDRHISSNQRRVGRPSP